MLLVISLIVPTLALLTGGGIYLFGKSRYEAAGPLADKQIVWLKKGLGLNAITAELSKAGVIETPLIFRIGARLSGAANSLKAGEYEFPAHISMAEIVRMLKDGKRNS